jgi:hypothetical protein
MNQDFPPFALPAPLVVGRRRSKGLFVPLEPERIERRQEIAKSLNDQLSFVSRRFRQMTEEQRKAVFYKLEHEGRVKLSGIGLKTIAENDDVTIAVPNRETIRTGSLDQFAAKISDFGEGRLTNGQPQNPQIGRLTSITEGEPTDRLSDSLLRNYETLVRENWVTIEIEILSLLQGASQQREDLRQIRAEIETEIRGTGTIYEHEDSGCISRVVLGCDGHTFKRLVEEAQWQVKVTWFESRPKFETFFSEISEFEIQRIEELAPPDENAPIVCIVDSGITHGNPFLEPVTKEELLHCFLQPNGRYGTHDEVRPDGHGSGVASLAAYHSLNIADGGVNTGKLWIASARVLDENCEAGNRLFSKMLREVVTTFKPLGVKIFNVSINDRDQHWHENNRRSVPRNSWIARSIDKLAFENDVVFVVSSGNLKDEHVEDFLSNGSPYPDYFIDDGASILDPAQAALALTVGAISPGTLAAGRVAHLSAIADANHPAPFTRCGPGINKEIKPELVEHGGNYLVDEHNAVFTNPGTNILMASNKLTPAITTACGTSFSTPKVTHKLALVLSDLESLGLRDVSAPLLKALIVNSGSYDFMGEHFERFKNDIDNLKQRYWLHVLGHGLPDDLRATYCDDYSALLYFQGEIESNDVAYFSIPVPEVLANARRGTKRISVTLAFDSEVQNWGLEEYLGTKLKWRIFRGNINPEDVVYALSSEDDDVVLPAELNNPRLGIELRSRGTIQHDVYEWEIHQPGYSENNYTLAVVSHKKWSRNVAPVRYGLVVRIEETTRTAPIYSEIQNVLNMIEIQSRIG